MWVNRSRSSLSIAPASTSHLAPCDREPSRLAILARTLDGGREKSAAQRRNWLRRSVRGGAAELPVIDKERRGEAQQRLHGQEICLASAGYGPPAQQLPELLPRLADRQIHVTPEIGHIARVLALDDGGRPGIGAAVPCECLASGLFLA